MDAYNSINNFLISLFQEVSISGITDNNKGEIEQFFTTILDTSDINAFKNPLLFQIIILLEREKNTNKVLDLLIEEVKLKALRVLYTSPTALPSESKCDTPTTNCTPQPPECTVQGGGKRWLQRPNTGKITLQKSSQDKVIYDGLSNGLLSRIYWENEDKEEEVNNE